MNHHWVTRVLPLVAGFMQIHAELTISTSTPTPCYGDVVTLVCHHPEVASNPGRYFSQPTAWEENGVGITPSTGTVFDDTNTAQDLESSTLTINITVDHFRNKSFNYSCLLVLAENGRPTGEVETSENVTVDPVDPRPPSSINIITSLNTSIAFNWTHTPMECYEDRTSYYVSWVNINNNTENGFNDTGKHIYNITGLVVNNTYTISVKTVVDRNVLSTAVSRDVTTGKPRTRPKNQTQPVCHNRNFTLACEVPMMYVGNYSNIYWILDSRNISGFTLYNTTNNGTELVIHKVTTNTTGDYGCCIDLNNGTLVEGEPYGIKPLDSPKKPHNLMLTSNVTGISVSWEHDRSCFEDHEFEFIVTWQKVDTSNGFMNMTVNKTTFNIQDLAPGTNYKICVTAISTSDEQVRSEKKCLYIKTSRLSVPGPSPLTVSLPYLALIIVWMALVGVIVAGVYLWTKRKSRRVKYESLWLFQVTDSLNRNGVKIISVRGHCVSAKCDPCHCRREAMTVDVYGTFNEKSFIMTFLKSDENNMEGFIAELLQQKNILSADYCCALYAGGSVPRKVRSQFKKEPEWRKGDCAVLPVQGFPWKVGSQEKKRFVQLFKACFPPLPIEFKASSIQKEITSPVEESEQDTVPIPHSDPPQVDVVKLMKLLLISKPPTTEEDDGDVKIPIKSDYASVNASPLDKYEPDSSPFADAMLSEQDTSVVSDGRRRSYTRASFIDGVVSVLEILHVTILSVGRDCRRPECQDANSCTHMSTFQPDVVGGFGDASFVIKCVLHHHDGDVTGDHMATLNNVRTGLGLPLGLLMYDHMEEDPQLLSQQIPNGCSLVRVGAFTWDSDWVESTLIALCKAFITPVAVDTHPPVHQVQYTDILVDKNRPVPNPTEEKINYSEISGVGVEAAQLVEDKPPPVPPKKETSSMEEQFQTDVIEALTEIGMTLLLREPNFFTAMYESMEFLGVSRVESEEDITPVNVEKVVKVKTKMAASRAVLICNQNTMGSDRLVDLQTASCYFIKAGGYGSEKWKNWLISNFKETVGDWMKEQNPGPHYSVEAGVLPEDDKGLLHSDEEEGGVGHPEEESGSSHLVEETEVAGQYDEQESTGRITPMTLVTRLESPDVSEEQSPLSTSECPNIQGQCVPPGQQNGRNGEVPGGEEGEQTSKSQSAINSREVENTQDSTTNSGRDIPTFGYLDTQMDSKYDPKRKDLKDLLGTIQAMIEKKENESDPKVNEKNLMNPLKES